MPSERHRPCDRLAHRLADVAGAEAELGPAARRHLGRCLRCQARAAQHRRLDRALHAARAQVVAPAPGLLALVATSLDEVGDPAPVPDPGRRGRRLAAVGGLAAAATATAAGAVVLVARSRRRLPLAG